MSRKAQVGTRLATKRLNSAEHKLPVMVYNISGRTPVAGFKIEDRFSWASRRATKRREDKAYSLLGLFDIYMPLLYGEGEERAFV